MSLTKATYSMISGAPANVLDFGAVNDGITDSTSAIQAALNSGAKKIIFPAGAYLVSSGLTIPDYLELEGIGYPVGVAVGSAAIPVQIKSTQTSGILLTCGQYPVIKNIYFKGNGSYNETTYTLSGTTAAAIKIIGDANIEECCFALWYTAIEMDSSYYIRTRCVEFNRCTYGYKNSGGSCYDVNIDAPTSRLTAIFFGGTGSAYARNIKVYGGSIEGFSNIADHIQDISIFGTYFETDAPRAGWYGITGLPNGAHVALYGCLIYTNYIGRFVNMSALTNCSLTSVGNTFESEATASSYIYYLPDSGNVHLSGDILSAALNDTCLYVQSIAAAGKFNVSLPALPATNTLGAFTNKNITSPGGVYMVPLTAAPTQKNTGMLVCADGVSWDPLTKAYSRPYWVVWQGDRWYSAGG